MQVKASLRDAPLSAQKGRLIADMIRNVRVADATDVLRFTPKKGARMMLKLLESAIANAENNFSADIDELKVATVHVEEGRTLKRMQPRAKGRGNRISKRTCHMYITLGEE